MSKIVISGYYGFNNAGDEAMLTAILAALRAIEPQVDLTVISGNPTDTKTKHNVKSIYRFDAFRIMNAFKNMDLLISGGGSLLQDVTSKKSLLYYLAILAGAKHFNKRVMLYAQGIGPIRDKTLRSLTARVCKGADLITVRDQESAEELRSLGVPGDNLEVTADAVLSLDNISRYKGLDILAKAGLDPEKPMIGVSVRSWPEDTNCLRQLGKALGQLGERYKAQVVLLPFQFPVDIEACEWLKAYIPAGDQRVVLLEDKYSTEEFMSIMGNFKLLIGMRLHALVFAAVMKVPLLAISYDPKVDSFVKAVEGCVAGTVADLEASRVVEAAAELWDKEPVRQNEKIEALRQLSQLNSVKAFGLIGK